MSSCQTGNRERALDPSAMESLIIFGGQAWLLSEFLLALKEWVGTVCIRALQLVGLNTLTGEGVCTSQKGMSFIIIVMSDFYAFIVPMVPYLSDRIERGKYGSVLFRR